MTKQKETLYLKTLDGLSVEGYDFANLKAVMLFAYLVLEAPEGINRTDLANLFWDDANANKTRSLSNSLSQLRKTFGEDVFPKGHRNEATFQLNLNGVKKVVVDIESLEKACEKGELDSIKSIYKNPFCKTYFDKGTSQQPISPEAMEWVERIDYSVESSIWQAYFAKVSGLDTEIVKILEDCYKLLGYKMPTTEQQVKLLYSLFLRGNSRFLPQLQKNMVDLDIDMVDLNLAIADLRKRLSEDKNTIHPYDRNERLRSLIDSVKQLWIVNYHQHISEIDDKAISLEYRSVPEYIDHPHSDHISFLKSPSEILETGNILDLFNQANNYLLILGDAGSGKTTTLLKLLADLVNRTEENSYYPVPVLFNLTSWSNTFTTLKDWLVSELIGKRYRIDKDDAEEWVTKGQIIPLLDDLDRVPNDLQNHCINCINLHRNLQFSGLVVASRVENYNILSSKLTFYSAVLIEQLKKDSVIKHYSGYQDNVKHIVEALEKDFMLAETVNTPLMVSVLKQTYQNTDLARIQSLHKLKSPQILRSVIFENYIEEMLSHHRGSKNPYQIENTISTLHWLAYNIKKHRLSTFFISDLQPSWLADTNSRWLYVIVSRTMMIVALGFLMGVFLGCTSIIVSGISQGIATIHITFKEAFWLCFTQGVFVTPFAIVLDSIRFRQNQERPTYLLYGIVLACILLSLLFFWNAISAPLIEKLFLHTFVLFLLWCSVLFGLYRYPPSGITLDEYLKDFSAEQTPELWAFDIKNRFYATGISRWSLQVALHNMFNRRKKIYIPIFLSLFAIGCLFWLQVLPTSVLHSSSWQNTFITLCALNVLIGLLITLEGLPSSHIINTELQIRPKNSKGLKKYIGFLTVRGFFIGGLGSLSFFGLMFAAFYMLTSMDSVAYARFVSDWNEVFGIPVAMALLGIFTINLLVQYYFDLIKHMTLRIILLVTIQLPNNFSKFLNYSSEKNLLRNVGDGYIFFHNLLLDYFSDESVLDDE